MTTEYEISKDDLIAFSLYHHRHSPAGRRQYLRAWLAPAGIWLLLCTGIWYLGQRGSGSPLQAFFDLSPLFSGVPLHLIYAPWAYRRKLRKIVSGMLSEGHSRSLLGHHRVAISPESVTDSSEYSQTSTVWLGVERVAVADEYAYIYTSALAAIVVPRRAFTDSEFAEFVGLAKGYQENAATTSAPAIRRSSGE